MGGERERQQPEGKAVGRRAEAAGGGGPRLAKRVPVAARGGGENESGGAREACRSGRAGRGETPEGEGGLHSCDEEVAAGGGAAGEEVEGVSRASVRTPGWGQSEISEVKCPVPQRPRLHRRGADWRYSVAGSRAQPMGRGDPLPQRDCGRFSRPFSCWKKEGKERMLLSARRVGASMLRPEVGGIISGLLAGTAHSIAFA